MASAKDLWGPEAIGAMVNSKGEAFYPDSPQEVTWFALHHDAWFLGQCDGIERALNPCTCSCYGCKHHCGGCWRHQ